MSRVDSGTFSYLELFYNRKRIHLYQIFTCEIRPIVSQLNKIIEEHF